MERNFGRSLILFLLLIPMLYHADYVTEGARYGLLLWYHSVVPALFPFMILTGLLVVSGGIPMLMTPFYSFLHPLWGISKNGCYVLISGLLCGCPMGAKNCADFVEDGLISLEEGKFLLAICNHPSPMFLLGYMYPFFSEEFQVWELLLCVYFPIVFLAFAAHKIYLSDLYLGSALTDSYKKICTNFAVSLDDTILSAVETLCKIGGYLMLFSIGIQFLNHNKRIPNLLRVLAIGSLEITTGIQELSMGLPMAESWIASVATLTFGGFSAFFQTKSVLSVSGKKDKKKAGLSIRPYFFWKLAHAFLSAGTAYLLCIMH